MRLKSHFVDCLPEEPESDRGQERLDSVSSSLDPLSVGLDSFEQFHIEELSRDFLDTDLWNMVS